MAESKQYLLPNTQGRYVTVTVTDTSGEVYRINDDGTRTIYGDYFVENGNTVLEASTFSSQEFQRNLAQNSQGYNRTISNSVIEASGTAPSQLDPNQQGVESGSTPINNDANESSTAAGASGDLRYPLSNDGGYDFLKITTHELNRSANLLAQQGFKLKGADESLSGAIGASIALPMQPGLSDSNSVDWGADQLNPLQLLGARAAAGGIENFAQLKLGEGFNAMINQVVTGIRQAGGSIDPSDIISYFAGQAVGANIFTRSTGKVINPNLELLFRGPQLRTFNYSYRFTPRSNQESAVIKNIIRHFKKYMAVRRDAAGLFLKTPYVFKLSYVYSEGGQHPFLNKIKPCALTNFNVDYTPDGSYTTYKDGSMTSYSVSMQFSELTPIYEDDYKDSDNDMGY